jgi:Uma2 family endonuclease
VTETRTRSTAQELLGLPDNGKRYELVEGELREMSPAGARHGSVAARLTVLLGQLVRGQLVRGQLVRAESLGIVLAAKTGVKISRDPDTIRVLDVSFVARGRVPTGGPPEGYRNLAPDLVVEVVPPSKTASEVQTKVQTWLEAGACPVQVLYSDTRSAVVYESLKEIDTRTTGDNFRWGDVVLGFGCPVDEVFE